MKFRSLAWLLIAGLLAAAPCAAEVEWRVEKELKLDAAPLDLATSASGQWLFVLTAGGKVAVFSSQGDLNDKFDVDPGGDVEEVAEGLSNLALARLEGDDAIDSGTDRARFPHRVVAVGDHQYGRVSTGRIFGAGGPHQLAG